MITPIECTKRSISHPDVFCKKAVPKNLKYPSCSQENTQN